jgi:hypothetical protein
MRIALAALLLSSAVAQSAPPPRYPTPPRVRPEVAPPARAERITAADGTVYELHPDGFYRAAPGVAAPQTFRGSAHDADHNCDRCGAAQYVVSGRGPVPGSHTHTCARCGHSWWH